MHPLSPPSGMLRRTVAIPLLLAVVLLTPQSGCNCDIDPDDISVDPDCPNGVTSTATVTITGDLDGIRPVDDDKLLRLLGSRQSTEVCVPIGAQHSFTEQLTGDSTISVTVPDLAHGQWEFSIVSLSGGDHPESNQVQTLTGGGSHTLTVTGGGSGDISAVFGP